MMFISATGDKLKSEADAALQAQMQRQERLAISSMEAAEVTYECVLMEAKSGIKACESGAYSHQLCASQGPHGQPSCLVLKDDSMQACSCDFFMQLRRGWEQARRAAAKHCRAACRQPASPSLLRALQSSKQTSWLLVNTLLPGSYALTRAWTNCLSAPLHCSV